MLKLRPRRLPGRCNSKETKAAGEVPPPSRSLTGQGSHVGGIYNDSAGILTISYSTVNQNHGCDLYNLGVFTEDSHSKIGVMGP